MRTFLLTALAIVLTAASTSDASLAQPVKTYSVLSDTQVTETGRYLTVYARGDTLRIWMEHVPSHKEPNRIKAESADGVVWCYPQRKPHSDHLFPEASGKVYVFFNRGMVSFYTRDGLKKSNMEKHVSSL